MENHGLIVTANDKECCLELHNKVNNRIKEHLQISEEYPKITIDKNKNEDVYISSTKYLHDFFKGNTINNSFFEKIVLYPDQLVYLNDSVIIDTISSRNKKLSINTKTGELVYRTNYQEALTIEETLLAYIYIVNKIKDCGFNIKSMTKEEVNYICNWESEKYRSRIMQ